MVSFDLSSSAKVTRRTDQYHRFLLKYVARDQVELLGRGNGGIVEIRNAIAQYEEPVAPLFGFLRYRRRNVVIKYVPEECSRLVQGESLPDGREKSSDEN
jgi:hypothetical protein